MEIGYKKKETEKNMTVGTIMFYGGIAGSAIFLFLLIGILATTGKKRRKMIENIQREM